MKAIISVSDKTGVTELARDLAELGWEIYSTGGTQKALTSSGIEVKTITELTGFPEILDGRVKTLHPIIYAGILARRDKPEHMQELERQNIDTIDLVAVNLYPFLETVTQAGVTLEEALENIDIGGPSLLRACAKNFPHVIVLTDPADYSLVTEGLRQGEISLETRRRLAQKAFQHTALYDSAISRYLRQGEDGFPEELTLGLTKRYDLRYGENPHQKASFYAELGVEHNMYSGITHSEKLGGKELSFNNILDADAAWGAVCDFAEPTVAVVKHTNPCGLACHSDILEAYRLAYEGDPISAFGGIVATNRPVTQAMAQAIVETFYEIVIAPDFEDEALKLLKERKNLRILRTKLPPDYPEKLPQGLDYRYVVGGMLVQDRDISSQTRTQMQVVTKREPTEEEWTDLLFSWKAVKHIKSNAIVIAKNKALLGMGAGQPNRVTSVVLARVRAGEKAKGAVMASDAMFPFPDSIHEAAKAGVSAVIQPGGSIRDQESIDAADEYNMTMVFTGVRHFRH